MAWFRSIQEGGDVDKTPPANGNILQYYSSTRTWQLVSIATLSLQPLNANLGSLSSLTYSAVSFVKMTGANTFGLDASVYLNLDQTIPQSVTVGRPNFTQGIQFGTNPTVGGATAGKLYWDATWQTLALNLDANANLQIGQESMIRVIAGENITNGDACYIYSGSGVYPIVKKAIATSEALSRVKGIATETFASSSQGFITNFGIINDLNTSSYNIGDIVYLSASTAGALTATKPAPPNLQVVVGRVIVKDGSTGSIYRSASPNYPICGDQVDLQSVGTIARHSVQDLFNTGSVGMISGGTIANAGSQQITVGSGTGIIAIGTLDTDPVCFCSWSAKTATTVTDARVTWVTVQYNSGSPQIVLIEGSSASDYAVPAAINYQDVFPLGYVTRNGTELYVTNNPRRIQDLPGGVSARFYQTLPLARDERIGGLILGETGTRNITMSAGKLWDRQNSFVINAIDTSAAGTGTIALVFSTWQRDGGTGNFIEASNIKAWPNTQYDLNGVLTTVPANRWANLWWYLSTEGYLAMVYGRALYTSAAAAAAGLVPSTLPLPLWTHFRLIARTTFQGSAATFTAIDSAFSNTFQPSAAATHNNLSGLQGGTAAEYYHLTSPQHATLTTIAAQNYVFAGPTSGTGPAVYRALVAADVPTLNQNTTGSAGFSTLSATATWALLSASANYAVQAGTATYAVLAASSTYGVLAASATYAVQAGTSTYAVLAASATYAILAATATYAITSATATWAILSASANFAVAFTDAPSDGDVYGRQNGTWATTGGGGGAGTVTEVDLKLPTDFAVNPSQVTTAGTLTAAWITTIAQNYIFAAPTSGTGGPAFRAMDAADVPTLNQNTTGSAGFSTLSSTATYAILAASATYALLAATADYVVLAASATYAVQSGTASYALTSATATWAIISATANYCVLSATATYAVTAGAASNVQTFATAGAAIWTKPDTGNIVMVQVWGGGGSGGRGGNGNGGGGGGGGSFVQGIYAFAALNATETLMIATGGAALGSAASGNTGGTSAFGTWLVAYGGGGGGPGTSGGGGGGAGVLAAGARSISDSGGSGGLPDGGYGGTGNEGGTPTAGGYSYWGGAGGGGGTGGSAAGATGGTSVWGGGGGGGASDSGTQGAGGISKMGGNGGAANNGTNAATAGSQPGGGGGGSENAASGAGGNGKIIVYTW